MSTGGINVRALADQIFLRVIKESTTTGGILIPDNVGDKSQIGQVLKVGPGKPDEKGHLRAPDIKVGDRVLFGKYAGTEIKLNGQDILVIREQDIMGVIEG